MKRRTVLMLLTLVVALAGVGFWMFDRKTPDVVGARPDFILSAADLTRAFEEQGAAAQNRFNGKIIRVSGTVKNVNASGAVTLGSAGTASEVVIGLDRRHASDVRLIKVGMTAAFQGVYSGYEKAEGSGGDDLLAGLGATVQLRSAGLKSGN